MQGSLVCIRQRRCASSGAPPAKNIYVCSSAARFGLPIRPSLWSLALRTHVAPLAKECA